MIFLHTNAENILLFVKMIQFTKILEHLCLQVLEQTINIITLEVFENVWKFFNVKYSCFQA